MYLSVVCIKGGTHGNQRLFRLRSGLTNDINEQFKIFWILQDLEAQIRLSGRLAWPAAS